jgi:hypothetical protein
MGDWHEGNPGDPRLTDELYVSYNSLVDFMHEYDKNPQPKAGDDIAVQVYVVGIADHTIHPVIGGMQLVGAPTDDGSLPANVIGVSIAVIIDVLSLPSVLPSIPEVPTMAPPPVAPPMMRFEFVTANTLPQRGTYHIVSTAAGVVTEGEQRFYELRIVTFDENGELIELKGEDHAIRLDDEELKAIFPFNPSKLPELFRRLPADRYRIYLIEDNTERLLLEFIIQQGQPIETPDIEDIEIEPPESAVDPFHDDDTNEQQQQDDRSAEATGDQLPAAAVLRSDEDAPRADSASFAERLGNASFVSHGGLVLGAAALTYAASDRWEKSIERLMERFDRRRRMPPWRRRTKSQSRSSDAPQREPIHSSL